MPNFISNSVSQIISKKYVLFTHIAERGIENRNRIHQSKTELTELIIPDSIIAKVREKLHTAYPCTMTYLSLRHDDDENDVLSMRIDSEMRDENENEWMGWESVES